MRLSERLQAVFRLTEGGVCVADIGTDHAYLPIELVRQGKYQRAIAMDVKKGPLERAKEHIEKEDMAERIELRLSDGMQMLSAEECDTVVIAGMGGALTIKIMQEGEHIRESVSEWILQPQSELHKVRAFLQEQGYLVVDEDMVFEDGKFYPMMKVVKGQEHPYDKMELLYGRKLLAKRHPVLIAYLIKEIKVKELLIDKLTKESCDAGRVTEVQKELMLARAAYLKCM